MLVMLVPPMAARIAEVKIYTSVDPDEVSGFMAVEPWKTPSLVDYGEISYDLSVKSGFY